MPAPAPLLLEDIVRHHPSFEELEDFIGQLPISEAHRSALWLWARFSPPPEQSVPCHRELEQRLLGHDEPASLHDGPAPRPARHPGPRLTGE